jgi:hypothetical protein
MKTNNKIRRLLQGGFRRITHNNSPVLKKGTEVDEDDVLKNFIWGMTNQKPI